MNSRRIALEKERDISIIHIQHPPANSLDLHTVQELANFFKTHDNLGPPRVIIVTGSDDVFSAGAELKELEEARTAQEAESIVQTAKALFDIIERYKKPVLAAINGGCLGGGLELALACHMRIGAENAQFGFPEINLGLMPGAGGTQRLPRLIGMARSFEIILTGELFGARKAFELGLLNELTPPGQALESTKEIALKISGKSQIAVASALESIGCSLDTKPEEGMLRETCLFGALSQTSDARERISAFFQKRKGKLKDQ